MDKEILKLVREKGSIDSEIENMSLAELRKVHQILFDEAVNAGRLAFGDNFDIELLKKKIDNTFEHMHKNMCMASIDFCNRNSCDHYNPRCVSEKLKDQIGRLISEILYASAPKFDMDEPDRDLIEYEELVKLYSDHQAWRRKAELYEAELRVLRERVRRLEEEKGGSKGFWKRVFGRGGGEK